MSDSHITSAILKLFECFLLDFWVDENDSKIRLRSDDDEEVPNELHSDKFTNHLQMLFQFSLVWAAGLFEVHNLLSWLTILFPKLLGLINPQAF